MKTNAESSHTRAMPVITQSFLIKQFLSYAIPTALSSGVYFLYTVIDGIFLGRFVGPEALAALTLIVPMLYLPYAFSVMISVGGSTLAARLLGEKKTIQAAAVFTQSLWMALLIGLIFSITFFFFSDAIVSWLGGKGQLAELASGYLKTYALFSTFGVMVYLFEIFLRIENAARYGLLCIFIGAIINTILDYIFIVKMQIGMNGSALATGIGMLVPTVMMLHYHVKKANYLKPIKNAFSNGIVWGRIAHSGISEFLSEIAPAVTIAAFNIVILKMIGEIGLVAFAMLEYMTMGAIIITIALIQSMQPMISFYRGAGNRQAVFNSFKIGAIAIISCAVIACLAMLFGSRPLTNIFVDLPADSPVWIILKQATFWYAIAFVPAAINFLILGYLTAIEAPTRSAIIAILRSWLFLLLALWLLTIGIGANGIWLAGLIAELLTVPASIILYRISPINSLKLSSDCEKQP